MSTCLALVISIFGQLHLRDVVVYGLLTEDVGHERAYFTNPAGDYQVGRYLDYGLSMDIEKGKTLLKGYPSVKITTGLGTSPSGICDLTIQAIPEFHLLFERSNNPFGRDHLVLGIQKQNYGSLNLTHDYLNRHFTDIDGRVGIEHVQIRAFKTWLDTVSITVISPRARYNFKDWVISGRADLGSGMFYNLRIGYIRSPISIGVNLYNPLIVRPGLLFSVGDGYIYARSQIRPLYLNDIYQMNRFAMPKKKVREKTLYDFGLEYLGLSIGHAYYDSLPYFPDTIDHEISQVSAQITYISIQKRIFDLEIQGRCEFVSVARDEPFSDLPHRNRVEASAKYDLRLNEYQVSPIVDLYYLDKIDHRFDLILERDLLGFLTLRFGMVNILDQEFVQPEDFLTVGREFFVQLKTEL